MKVSVVVPVYGCRGALDELHRRLVDSLRKIADDYEIILVNDDCPQNSWEVIMAICARDHHVKGMELSRNFGQMRAILAGLDIASGDWIVVMDCDLQDRPEDIPRLYKKAMEGYDVVFAKRISRRDGFGRTLLANTFYKVYEYATDGNYDGSICNFSIVKNEVIRNYCRMREYHRGYVIYLRWLGYKQATINVERDDRYEGKSSYSLKKRVDMALDLLTSQSDKVLRMFVKLGFLVSVIAFLVIVFLIIYRVTANVTIGWTSMIATLVLVGGILTVVMGVVGIYVGNIFMQTKERPLYIVRQILNEDDKGE